MIHQGSTCLFLAQGCSEPGGGGHWGRMGQRVVFLFSFFLFFPVDSFCSTIAIFSEFTRFHPVVLFFLERGQISEKNGKTPQEVGLHWWTPDSRLVLIQQKPGQPCRSTE